MRVPRTDLQGLARLGIDGVHGVTDLVEDLHHAILRVPGLRSVHASARTGGIPGLVYRSIHGVTGLVGGALDLALRHALPGPATTPRSPGRERLLAIVNGVLGDHLHRTANPLAFDMTLRRDGRVIAPESGALAAAFPQASRRIVVTAHGLCMHDAAWYPDPAEPPVIALPTRLAAEHAWSVLDLRYNSGRHIFENGRDFADLLEQLVSSWPVEIDELVVLGHSMGGLVARSAAHYGLAAGHAWPAHLKKLVFLGTPHLGSPLERAGHGIDRVLGISRYSAPFARPGRMRSAGITDLRHGNVLHGDPGRTGRFFAKGHADRTAARLPAGVECLAVAATLDAGADGARAQLVGDGLVPVASALGMHARDELRLPVAPRNRLVVAGIGHLQLLHDRRVAEFVLERLHAPSPHYS